MTRLDLLARVARFKSLFFASSWSDYGERQAGQFLVGAAGGPPG